MARASAIENVFTLLSDITATPSRTNLPIQVKEESDALTLLMEIRKCADALRSAYPTVESLYQAHRLQVLGVDARDEFDGFLLSLGKKRLVCVNTDRPDIRIEFTLLHEFAHFAFDEGKILPVDIAINPVEFFKQKISHEIRPEYIANKFAQCFLVPIDLALSWAGSRDPIRQAAVFVSEHGISPDVAAFSLYDAYWASGSNGGSPSIFRDKIRQLAGEYRGRNAVREFVKGSTDRLLCSAVKLRDEFGEQRWQQVVDAWGIMDGA